MTGGKSNDRSSFFIHVLPNEKDFKGYYPSAENIGRPRQKLQNLQFCYHFLFFKKEYDEGISNLIPVLSYESNLP
jgi:hypothetical protein